VGEIDLAMSQVVALFSPGAQPADLGPGTTVLVFQSSRNVDDIAAGVRRAIESI
jgi:hypothetical protein